MTRDLLGYLSAMLTTFAFLPQVVKVWKTREVRDISLSMYGLFVMGVALWVIYGLYIRSLPVVLANVATFLLSASVLVAKVRFERQGPCQGGPEELT